MLSRIYSSLKFAAPIINLHNTYLAPSDPHVLLDLRRFEWRLHSNLPLVQKKTTFFSPTFPLRPRVTRGWLGPSPV